MNVLNYKDEATTLTDLESKIYECLKESDNMDDCYCHCAEEISDQISVPTRVIRGAISSMVRKGVAYVEELVSGCGDWVILYENKS